MSKTCSRCKEELPLTTEFYQRDNSKKTGFRSDCKKCCKERNSDKKEYMRIYNRHRNLKFKEEKGVGYRDLHHLICEKKPKVDFCAMCNKKIENLELANISGKYYKDIRDYLWVCRNCHSLLDRDLLKEVV